MGFNINREEGIPEEITGMMDDIEKQIEFHKNNFITADIELVADVLKQLMVSIVGELDPDSGEGVMPMLTAIAETILELRATNEVLRSELIEKKSPPPDDFQFN